MSIKSKLSRIYPVFKGGRFFNHRENHKKENDLSNYLHLLKSFLHELTIFVRSFSNWRKRIPKNQKLWIEDNKKVIQKSVNPTITWIGHASFLIQIGDLNILTDPIFGDNTILFPRIFPPGLQLNELPVIDYVLISHNHMDHMDSKSLIALKQMFPEIKFLVPKGDKLWFDKRTLQKTSEFTWWDEYLEDKVKFTFLPAYHWSQRYLFDQNKSLWGSWMIQSDDFSIYFAGDTGYSEHFSIIANEFNRIDIALLPVGPCEPREKMCRSHISAEEAGKAFIELNASYFIPMHWGTFYFGIDYFDTPITRLKEWWRLNEKDVDSKILNILKFGQQLQLDVYQTQIIQPKGSSLEI